MTFSATNAASPVERRPGGQHRELVAAHSGHGVAAPHRTRQPPGDLLQAARCPPDGPRLSLTRLNRSRSSKKTASFRSGCRRSASARLTVSSKRSWLGSPVSASWKAWCLICSTSVGVLERARAQPRYGVQQLGVMGAEGVEPALALRPPANAPGSGCPDSRLPEFALAGWLIADPCLTAVAAAPGPKRRGLLRRRPVPSRHWRPRWLGESRRAVPDPCGRGASRPAQLGGHPWAGPRTAPPTSTPTRASPPRRPTATVVAQTRRRKPSP